MTDRHTADTITSDALDQLYRERDEARQHAAAIAAQRDRLRQRMHALADLIEAGAPWTANHDTIAARIREAVADRPPADGHTYLSTGCRHGDHTYCQNHTGQSGQKTPAQCKFCGSPCVCGCHQETAVGPLVDRPFRSHRQPAKEAAETEPREQHERPSHPDGTPYSYAEITAEGWGFCDGCRMWSTATPERPHQCTAPDQPTEQP